MYFYAFCLVLLILGGETAKLPEQIAEHSETLLKASQTGKKIRECTCDEQGECIKEMKKQFEGCFDKCWPIVSKEGFKLVKNPEKTKECFQNKRNFVDDMLDCMQNDLNTCVKEKESKEISYVDISKFLEKGEKKLQDQADLLFETVGDEGREVIDIAFKVGHCMRSCFVEKNAGGYCYDKKGCQPLLESEDTGSSVKKCLKEVGWKKQAQDVCKCTVKAGVEEADRWCAVIETVASSKNPVPTAD
uniref:Uncharacterized protein n=1 Tax=Panagrolaimus superbus TaxID=310955 RepID=A0A914Y457_9BILA